MSIKVEPYLSLLDSMETVQKYGKVTQVIGLTIESLGPEVKIGELCYLYPGPSKTRIEAEVVGFRENRVLLMPMHDLSEIGPGCLVVATGQPLEVKVGYSLLGTILDGRGRPLDYSELPGGLKAVSTNRKPPNPMTRPRISTPFQLGVRAIDGLLTVGQGQRIGIFAGSGVGKSTE